MNAMKQRSLAILVSMVLALIMVVAAGCPTAQAAQLEKAWAGTYYPYTLDGREYTIGVSARGTQGHNYYCRQIAMETDYITTDSVVMASDDTSRRLAWLINSYIAPTMIRPSGVVMRHTCSASTPGWNRK